MGSQAVTIVSDSVLWLEGYPPSSQCVIFLMSTIFIFDCFNDKSPNLTRFLNNPNVKSNRPMELPLFCYQSKCLFNLTYIIIISIYLII